MRNVSIIGIGQSPVGELWDRSIRHLGYDAVSAAMTDAGIERADALFVGNMLSGSLLDQEHLATLIADFCGLRGIEAAKVEAACASGAAALRVGTMAVASGMHDIVIVAGVEKMTDTVGKDTTVGLASAAEPSFAETAAGFKITLQSAGVDLVNPQATTQPWKHTFLNERQETAMAHVRENGRITNSDYLALIPDVSAETIRRDLADLVEKNLLLRIGEKRATYYILK